MNLKITSIKVQNAYFSGKQSSCFKSGKSVGTRLNSSRSENEGFIAGIKNSFRSTTRWIKKHANEIIAVLGSLAVAGSGFLWFKRSTSNHSAGETNFSYKSPEVLIDASPPVNEAELERELEEATSDYKSRLKAKGTIKEEVATGLMAATPSALTGFVIGNIIFPGIGGIVGAISMGVIGGTTLRKKIPLEFRPGRTTEQKEADREIIERLENAKSAALI